ncbi:MAG: WD40/YVTN/BNR-like repeat-containing protein [Terriglobales bacterium]
MFRRVLLAAAVCALAAPLALSAQQISPDLYGGLSWRMIGPFRAGRGVAVAGAASEPDTFYFGAVDGGVWKTINDGTTWTPIFDKEPVASIGAIAVAPSDPEVIYVGTGEADPRSQSSVGDGMFKSTDAGQTWTRIGLEKTRQIGRIIVDPHDPNRVYVAALGDTYAASSARGVYRSTDGGVNWQKVLFTNDNAGAEDLALDPSNPQTIYATLWATRRPPWVVYPSSVEPGSGLYKSTDGGSTWHQLSSGLPAAGVGKIGVAVAPSDPSRVYAIVDASEKAGGLYRSDDGGATWRQMDNDGRIWHRGWYFEAVTVDPVDENTLYTMDTSTYRSTDGGAHFVAIKGAPGGDDYHQLWINPGNHTHMILSSDQGVIVTVDGAKSWSSWNNQPTGQYYHVTADNRTPFWVYGAEQDSGARAVATATPRGGRITYADWTSACTGGESGDIAADPLSEATLYGGAISRCNQLTGASRNIAPMLAYPGQDFRHTWTLPVAFSMANKHDLYFANQFLFRTSDGGASWDKISPDLTRKNPGAPPNLDPATAKDTNYSERSYGTRWGVIYTIAPSPILANEIWVGTDDGLIQMTRDGGKSWNNVTPPALTAWSKVVMMAASHFDPETAFAAVDRHRLDDDAPHIYRTTDGGKTWQEIVAGLPADEYLESITEDPVRKGLLFAGTSLGVYVSFDNGSHWQSLRLNMPPVEIRDFVIKGDTMVIATFGRAFWALDDISPLRQVKAAMDSAAVVLYQPATAESGTAGGRGFGRNPSLAAATDMDPIETYSGAPPMGGAEIDYYLKSDSGPVTLDILDANGKVVRHYSSTERPRRQNPDAMDTPAVWARVAPVLSQAAGMHRWSWDVRAVSAGAAAPAGDRGGFGGRGGAAGQAAAPGTYTVRLTAGGQSTTQPIRVVLAPGATYSPATVAAQARLTDQITAQQGRVSATRRQAARLHTQLQNLASQATSNASLLAAIQAAEAKAKALEGFVPEPPNPDASNEGDAVVAPTSLTGLNAILGGLAGAAQRGPGAPDATVLAGWQRAQVLVNQEMAQWNEFTTRDLAALNTQLKAANLPPLEATTALPARRGQR